MGKRKRDFSDVLTPPPSLPLSDDMASSSRLIFRPKEISSHVAGNSGIKPPSSTMSDHLGKDTQSSSSQQPFNLSRTMMLKRSGHYYGQQYSRRNSSNNGRGSTSHGNNSRSRDEKLVWRVTSHSKPDYGHSEDFRQKVYYRPERIRSGHSIPEAITDAAKMPCGICQKLLKRKQFNLSDGSLHTDVSVVAVLVCGHVYHADCLEQKTSREAKRDPPCPVCASSLRKTDDS